MFLESIRWRLQLWLAFLLLCTLSGFGVAMFELHRMQEFEPIEDELQQRLAELTRALHSTSPRLGVYLRSGGTRLSEWLGREQADLGQTNATPELKDKDQQKGESPSSLRQEPQGIEDLEVKGFYWAIWSRDGTFLGRSSNAPPNLLFPGLAATGPSEEAHLRSHYYEVYGLDPFGHVLLVGRSVALELKKMHSLALWLIGMGGAVLALGLGGGWWIVSGALRPVIQISETASRISSGNLSERINTRGSSSELACLAKVLNSMFERMETAFARQKQFTADASHELRTPLAIMITEAQSVLARPRTAAEYRQTVEICLDTAQQMARLTESLLELARFDAHQAPVDCQPLDLAEQAQQCVDFIRPLAAERGVQIRCQLQPSPMMGNPDYIGRAITNLLSNAVRYNRVNGEVQVTTGGDNASVFLVVADTGIGIEPEELPRIFDRFYRAEQARNRGDGCTGLGLAICKAIVDAHAGRIEVASRPGIGSTFTVTWPGPPHHP
jgi:heavy metal sensor kinase